MQEDVPVTRLNILDFLAILIKWRKLFLVNFLIVCLLASVFALLVPVWFTAVAVILPASGGGGGFPAFLSKDLSSIASTFGFESPSENVYQTILQSRTLKERVIERFRLREVYKLKPSLAAEKVLRVFDKHFVIETREDMAIAIKVEDQNPERAATMANACMDELDRIFRDISSETARKNRTYIGRRLAQVQDSLTSIEDSLKRFQQITGAVSIPDQISAMIKAAADLKAQQLSNDVKLEVMRGGFGDNHPMVEQLARASGELEDKYEALLAGEEGRLFLAMESLPELGQRYADIFRQSLIQEKLLEYIYPQYESALIQEERESSNIQVLDRARVPQEKTRPQRKMIVTSAGGVSILFTLVMVLVLEYWRSLPTRNAGDWAKWQRILGFFRRKS